MARALLRIGTQAVESEALLIHARLTGIRREGGQIIAEIELRTLRVTSTRQFLQSAIDSRNSVRELLQIVFASELLAPSRCLWLISPWLRDVPVLDNTTGSFLFLCPDLPLTEVRLSLVLRELVARGTQLVIATRPDVGNGQVLDALQDIDPRDGVIFHERAELHAKGIVGDAYSLIGSMNFTYNGLDRLTEMLVFQTERATVEQLRLSFRREYGGRAWSAASRRNFLAQGIASVGMLFRRVLCRRKSSDA